MSNKKSILSSAKWIFEVSNRFARIDRKGRSAVTSFLATLGICFGVMTLIAVLSVMNGFQQTSIKPIMEISSWHLRVSDIPEEKFTDFIDYCNENPKIKVISPFYDSQSLMVGRRGRQASAIIRALSPDLMEKDELFKNEAKIVYGKFNLTEENAIILGSKLASQLDCIVGDKVNLLALSGGKDVSLISQDRQFTVTGIFRSSYEDINSGYAFISLSDGQKYFGSEARPVYGIKLADYENDLPVVVDVKEKFPDVSILSWREFNRSFFGTLRIEKNILMLLVCIIFLVVGINIYNGMRRLVFERSQEISILSALGAKKSEIKMIFIMRGFTSGLLGSLFGAILGILISVNIGKIFLASSNILYFIQYFFVMLLNPDNVNYLFQNTIYETYARIPARILYREVFIIVLFGIAAPLWASWKASNNILNMSVAEVLHDE